MAERVETLPVAFDSEGAVRGQLVEKKVQAGFNLTGHLSSRTGLGAAARMTLELIQRNGWPVCTTDVATSVPARVPVESAAPSCALGGGPYSVNLLHLNPSQLLDGLLVWDTSLVGRLSQRYTAAVPYWELPTMPPGWVTALRGMDMILAPTRFIEESVRASLDASRGGPAILHFPQAVRPPEGVTSDRPRWFRGREGTTVFLASFDFSSAAARKNPAAVLAAFHAAFGGIQDVTLAFKVGNVLDPRHEESLSQLRFAAQEDSRVVLVEESLSAHDMWQLLASADCYVSLHRSEGLGLGMMESMSLGVPVIATGWSGNMDFMTRANSHPVAYRLVAVDSRDSVVEYNDMIGRTVWAEPDVDAAAGAMRRLHDEPGYRLALGEAARHDIDLRWQDYSHGSALRQTLERAASADLRNPMRAARVARLDLDVRLRRAAASMGTEAFKQRAVRALRTLKIKPPAPDGEISPGPLRVLDPSDHS